jgi:hypothetical protein
MEQQQFKIGDRVVYKRGPFDTVQGTIVAVLSPGLPQHERFRVRVREGEEWECYARNLRALPGLISES